MRALDNQFSTLDRIRKVRAACKLFDDAQRLRDVVDCCDSKIAF